MKKLLAVAAVSGVCLASMSTVATAHSTAVCTDVNTITVTADGYSDGSSRTIDLLIGTDVVGRQVVQFGNTQPVALTVQTFTFYVTAPGTYTVVDTPFGVEQRIDLPCGKPVEQPLSVSPGPLTPIPGPTSKPRKRHHTPVKPMTCKRFKATHPGAPAGAYRKMGFKPNCGVAPKLPPPRKFNPPVTG